MRIHIVDGYKESVDSTPLEDKLSTSCMDNCWSDII